MILATRPQPHRQITAIDTDNPTTTTISINTKGYDEVQFWLDYVTGGGTIGITAVPLWWDTEAGAWYVDTAKSFTRTVSGALFEKIAAEGELCFLKVTALSGTSPSLTVRYSLAKTRSF